MSLAYFSAYYNYNKSNKLKKLRKDISRDNIENIRENFANSEDVRLSNSWIELQNEDGFIKLRNHPKVIRFCRYSSQTDPENFYREQLMLYIPWHNEELELLDSQINIKEKFITCLNQIKTKSLKFNKLKDEDEFEMLLNAIKDVNANQSDIEDVEEDINCTDQALEGFEYETNKEDKNANNILDSFDTLTDNTENENRIAIAKPSSMNKEEVLSLTRILNSDQRDFILHVDNYFSTQNDDSQPLYTLSISHDVPF